jgi:mannose-1-phosphate guanylyltransferase
MAGGSGTRFWPESRNQRPKQLLSLVGNRTMIQSTVDRLGQLVPADRVLIVTNARLVGPIAEQLPELPPQAILGEPCKRDTAPCIGLAALQLARTDPDAIMAVMPSDHVISPDSAFQEAIGAAARLVAQSPGRIVTFGIKPSYPAETFGYIERGEPVKTSTDRAGSKSAAASAIQAYAVRQFREKPKAEIAREYLAAGNFYWNSGIFLWHAQTILAALKKFQPEMYGRLATIEAAAGQLHYQATLECEFAAIRGVSIDYAVMEHARDVVVIEAPFAWDDVGSWQAMARLQGTDAEGNTIQARHLGLHTKGSIVRGGPEHLIVTLGVEDCIVVHTPDATLVANKHDEESIRQLVKLLEERGWSEYL